MYTEFTKQDFTAITQDVYASPASLVLFELLF